jgi:hypothetical protein
MAIQIKDLLGWKKSRRQCISKLGIAEYARIFDKQGPVSLLSSYDVAGDLEDCGCPTFTSRATGTSMLRRAQMLQ